MTNFKDLFNLIINNWTKTKEELENLIKDKLSGDQLTTDSNLDDQFVLNGMYYFKGLGLFPVDMNMSRLFFESALNINKNNSYALQMLGFMYKHGEGVEQDYTRALEFYTQGLELKNSAILNNLAIMYDEGLGVEKSHKKAFELYSKAMDLGDEKATYNVASMYNSGKGVEQSYEKARELYEKSMTISASVNGLACMYFLGRGSVPHDNKIAFELFTDAVKMGDSTEAMNNLAYMYHNGIGVIRDDICAYLLYKMAFEQGNTDCVKEYTQLDKQYGWMHPDKNGSVDKYTDAKST